jgi:hypothetical protein
MLFFLHIVEGGLSRASGQMSGIDEDELRF